MKTVNPHMYDNDPSWGLPDPETQPAFYDSVPFKRLLAFIVDLVAIVILSALVVPLTAFIGIFFFPFIVAVVSFAYRVVTIANGSATPGMHLMGIEFRTSKGEKFDLGLAFIHTALFTAWGMFFLPQVVSVVLMLTTARKQSLSDLILGSTAINKPSRF
ncbi:RDD family protein [Celeribacter sp.]|uniref:RDD family protein n=1 Tax=Celeribacter sp. TaxID=1890673 RepID=UPI003A8D3D44